MIYRRGEIWEVEHQRKGAFTICLSADYNTEEDEWISGVIVQGTAKAMLHYNVREVGESITMRGSFTVFVKRVSDTGEVKP